MPNLALARVKAVKAYLDRDFFADWAWYLPRGSTERQLLRGHVSIEGQFTETEAGVESLIEDLQFTCGRDASLCDENNEAYGSIANPRVGDQLFIDDGLGVAMAQDDTDKVVFVWDDCGTAMAWHDNNAEPFSYQGYTNTSPMHWTLLWQRETIIRVGNANMEQVR